MQVDASLQNQNLRTDLQWVAKRIRKSARKFKPQVVNSTHKLQNYMRGIRKSGKFHAYTTCDQLLHERHLPEVN